MTSVSDFLRYALIQVCSNTEAIEVKEIMGETGITTFEIHVAENDMPKVIGKNGQMIDALRTLVMSMARRNEDKFRLRLWDPKREANDALGAPDRPMPNID